MLKIVTDIVIPYVIFQSIWTLVQFLVEGVKSLDFTQPFASIAIAIALSSPIVRRVFRPLIEPKPRWLFIRNATEREQPKGQSRRDPTGSRRD